MPGSVPITSTYALTNATMPYVLRLAEEGVAGVGSDPGFAAGLNVSGGRVTNEAVARDQDLEAVAPARALESLTAELAAS